MLTSNIFDICQIVENSLQFVTLCTTLRYVTKAAGISSDSKNIAPVILQYDALSLETQVNFPILKITVPV